MNDLDDDDSLAAAMRQRLGNDEAADRAEAASHAVLGAAIEVHRILGPGYLEAIYQRALEEELRLRAIPFRGQVTYDVEYKGAHLGSFRLDLVVDDLILVELKHVEAIAPLHVAQTIGYLKRSGLRLGLILNFNTSMLKHGIRRVYGPPRPPRH